MNVWSASVVLTELLTYRHISRIQNNGAFTFLRLHPLVDPKAFHIVTQKIGSPEASSISI